MCCPSWNFVTLKLTTDEGITGPGDATLDGREPAVASYLTDHGATVYGHASGETIEDAVEAVGHFLECGYLAGRAQRGVPGAKGAYGVTRDQGFCEPASSGVAQELSWSTDAHLQVAPKLLAVVRGRHGFDLHLPHDAYHGLSAIEAARLGKAVEDCALFWLEDPVPAEHQEGYRLIRRQATTPLAELYDVRTGSHGATDLSPVRTATALHVDLSVPNFGIQEYMVHSEQTDAVFPHSYRFEDAPSAPGRGAGARS